MRDVLGWRCKFGVLGPSTNTIVQPDFEMMRPAGVTNHYSRIFTPNAQAVSNETFMAGTEVIGQNVLEAVRSVMTCSPGYLVMGMSAVTFYGGCAGADAFAAKVGGDGHFRSAHQPIRVAGSVYYKGGLKTLVQIEEVRAAPLV